MGGELSTIHSLRAVDAWIDVINANINGGVRTGFKSSRLKFGGTNVDIVRAGTGSSLPLQLPEAGLTTANTVIDFSQGAITASTESTHLALQGDDFFLLVNPEVFGTNGATVNPATLSSVKFYLTRDGEFRTDANGLLRHTSGLMLATYMGFGNGAPLYSPGFFGGGSAIRAVYNDLDNTVSGTSPQRAIRLSDYISQVLVTAGAGTDISGVNTQTFSVVGVPKGRQSLQYSQYGSTVFDFGYQYQSPTPSVNPAIALAQFNTNSTILSKSLEASNASMTQSVPELSLAQKLFSALTKVLQTKQTNVDGVLNLIR